jgi:hypothetical protein
MTQPPPLPEACSLAMAAALVDPLEPGAEAEAHLRTCRACSEARVAYLAQEDFPTILAPAGYFDRLPDRVLRKLPVRLDPHHRLRSFMWAAAATLLVAVGAGAFWIGHANRTPFVEATLPRIPTEIQELPDAPFQDHDEAASEDAVTQLTALSEDDAVAVIRNLSRHPAHAPVAK